MRAEQQPAWNGGELSARMEGRADLAVYGVAGREIANMILTVQGPAVKRSGTIHVAPAKAAANRVRLIPFTFNVTQTYVIEAGPGYFRFYTNDYRIETAPGTAYEIATPFAADDLAGLYFEQSADVLYLVCGAHPPHELRRTSATTFALAPMETKGGPLADQNSDHARTIIASAATGSIALTASHPVFAAGHVGSFIEIEAADFRSIQAWEPAVEVAIGNKRRSDGKVYEAKALPASGSKRTGTIQPTHIEGVAWDGTSQGKDLNDKDAGGVQWEYLYSRAGLAKITGYTSPTVVTADVVNRLPDELVAAGSWRWSLGWMNAAVGWPTAIVIRDERLIFARGYEIAASVVGDYRDFATRDESGQIQPDLAFRRRTASPNVIRWLANDRELLIGTAAGEYVAAPVNAGQALSAMNVKVPAQSFYGSQPVRPVQAGQRTLFVARTGRKLREAGFDYNSDRYQSPDMTVRSSHITAPGIIELAWQAEPEALIWALLANGRLACLTYSEEQEVRGWSSHWLAGGAVVESIAVIAAPDGRHDQLWLAVRRTVGGADVRHIERMMPWWEEGAALADAFFVDAGVAFDSDVPVTVVPGGLHLAGETVAVLVDGAVHPDCTVAEDGHIDLQRPGRKVRFGLLYAARVTTMQLNVDNELGSAQGRLKRVVKVAMRLLETLGIRMGSPAGRRDVVEFRTSAMRMDQPPALFSGDYRQGFPGGWERDARVTIESFQPLPFTLLSVAMAADVGAD